LQVIDDHQAQLPVLRGDAPQLASEGIEGEVRLVVDDHRGFREPPRRVGQPLEVALVELPAADAVHVHPRLAAQHPQGELHAGHLQAEDRHRLLAAQGDVLGDGEGEGRVVQADVGGDEIGVPRHRQVVDLPLAHVLDAGDVVPVEGVAAEQGEVRVVEDSGVTGRAGLGEAAPGVRVEA
jgi:hypothetical protein